MNYVLMTLGLAAAVGGVAAINGQNGPAAVAVAFVVLAGMGRWLQSDDAREARRVSDQDLLAAVRFSNDTAIKDNAALREDVSKLRDELRRLEHQMPRPPGSLR